MVVYHNMMAQNAHRMLGINQSTLGNSVEKLSSGLRVNRAADDAAGLSISEKMRGQIRGLTQASRNAQDAISVVQTAEGALNEVHDIIQRMRELAVQSANDSNVEIDRAAIQQEVSQLTDELDRIAHTTQFNTMTLLDGTFNNKVFHIGANKDQNLDVSIDNLSAQGLGLRGDHKAASAALGSTITEIKNISSAVADLKVKEASLTDAIDKLKGGPLSASQVAAKSSLITKREVSLAGIDVKKSSIKTSVEKIEGSITNQEGKIAAAQTALSVANLNQSIAKFKSKIATLQEKVTSLNKAGDDKTASVDKTMLEKGLVTLKDLQASIAALTASIGNQLSNGSTMKAAELEGVLATKKAHLSELQMNIDKLANFRGSIRNNSGTNNIHYKSNKLDSLEAKVQAKGGVLVNTQDTANRAIETIDAALTKVSFQRSELGAIQNRMRHTIKNLDNAAENTQAAEGRIRDTDMAKEMSEFTKKNILTQASQAMLAQANQLPQQVLQLLR